MEEPGTLDGVLKAMESTAVVLKTFVLLNMGRVYATVLLHLLVGRNGCGSRFPYLGLTMAEAVVIVALFVGRP